MTKIPSILAAACICLGCNAMGAGIYPTPVGGDQRVLQIQHSRNQVINIPIAEGVSTTVEIPNEVIRNFSMGDRNAWHVAIDGDMVVLKPKGIRPDTNLSLYGTRRNYLFYLVTAKKREQAALWVYVRGVDAESREAIKAKEDQKKIADDLRKARFEGPLNENYWIVGAQELQPRSMHDNGQQTYLTFSSAHSLPAAFIIEPDGSESIADFHVEGDTLVLHLVAQKIILRRGNMVAGISNRSVPFGGQHSPTGTVSDKVQRIVRERGGE